MDMLMETRGLKPADLRNMTRREISDLLDAMQARRKKIAKASRGEDEPEVDLSAEQEAKIERLMRERFKGKV